MPWVTINGNHVLIGEDAGGGHDTGGGHTGTHNPETSTGNKHVDAAVKSAVLSKDKARVVRNSDGDYEVVVKGKPAGLLVKSYLRLEGPSWVLSSSQLNASNKGFKTLTEAKKWPNSETPSSYKS